MTLYAWARSRRFPSLPAPEVAVLRRRRRGARAGALPLAARSARAADHPAAARPRRVERGALHDRHGRQGLGEGVQRRSLNQRNCGGTEHLSRGLYHSGLTRRSARRAHRASRSRSAERVRRRRLLSRRQPGDEAGRRAWRHGVSGAESGCRRVAGDRARGLHAGHRAARKPHLRVELLPQPAGAHAPQSPHVSRRLRSLGPVEGVVDPAVRRSLHRAASRVSPAPRTTITAPARCA